MSARLYRQLDENTLHVRLHRFRSNLQFLGNALIGQAAAHGTQHAVLTRTQRLRWAHGAGRRRARWRRPRAALRHRSIKINAMARQSMSAEIRVVWLITQRSGFKSLPAIKFAGQRPLLIMEGVFCVSRAHRIVHEASEGRCGGWTVRRTLRDVVRDADGEIGRGGWTGNGCQGYAVAGAGASSAPDYVASPGQASQGQLRPRRLDRCQRPQQVGTQALEPTEEPSQLG